ncbi:aspartate carbamoyltransferase [Methanosalsum natronophilum]|uniref:aspartate carbamoyltransferase n=1 Tax=Methanosalsum natronophilum TaxID=768733 RepID=UPI002168A5CD|nr:aspartate carbamoyltransferase [Methanosalsum natronophilum]
MNFTNMDIISMKDFSRDMIDHILNVAEELEPVARGEKRSNIFSNVLLSLLFFEPSTRTRMSFESAIIRGGGNVLNLGSLEASSISKGETLADTIRVVEGYADAIVLRHPKEGAARMAAEYSSVPIINAGDGAGQHPTQTLLDLYTIKRESVLDGVKIAIAGDLKYGRTAHSLCYALSLYGAEINLVSPDSLQMPEEIVNDLRGQNINVYQTSVMEEVIEDIDVLYATRIQKERFPDVTEYEKVAASLKITPGLLDKAKIDLKVMHPLPRVNEIDASIDNTNHACYFKQSFYGVPVRMALLSLVMGRLK